MKQSNTDRLSSEGITPYALITTLSDVYQNARAATYGGSADEQAAALRAMVEHLDAKATGPRVIRVFLENGLIESVDGIPGNCIVRKIDLDVEGACEGDTVELSADDRPAYKTDDEERAHGPQPIYAYVEDYLPNGSRALPYAAPKQSGCDCGFMHAGLCDDD